MPDATVRIEDFAKLSLKIAEVRAARPHPNADRLVILTVNTGSGERQIVAGIRTHYEPERLVGRKIVLLENLEPAVLRGERSEGMLLAATDAATGAVRVLTVDGDVAAGSVVR